jgi:NhaP-type Na+/H+ or K+/H+ antiporter
MDQIDPSFTFAFALGAGVVAQLIAGHLRIPSIVPLLATGIILGPDGLGLILPRSLGEGLFSLVSLAVAVILFEGGLNLDLRRLRREGSAIRRLVTIGALVTAAGGALAAGSIMGWSPRLSILFGALVIVTGPTVIRPLLRNVPLRPRLATVLEAEGVLIDPIGAIVAVVTLQIVLTPGVESFASGFLGLLYRLGFGTGAGLAFGFAIFGMLRIRRAIPEGLENLVVIGTALVAFEVCETVLSESGILAVTVAGVVVGNMETRVSQELGEFSEHLTVGLIGILFVLLAADVRISEVTSLGWPGLACVAALALIVRPAGVILSTAGSELDWRERAFLSWVAPRGVVAAAVASLAAAFLEESGIPGGAEIRALVFLTIGFTVVVQGGSGALVARMLGVRAPGRETVVILGAEELGFALGEVLREDGGHVVFADINPSHCRAAQERGFPVVYGNVLEPRTLARMRLERARAVIGLTANNEVNSHFAGEARDEFGVRNGYVAVNRGSSEVTSRIVEKQESRVLFDGPKDVERWHVRFRHGDVAVQHFRRLDTEAGATEAGEAPDTQGARTNGTDGVDPYILLAVRRGERWKPVWEGLEIEAGETSAVAVYQPAEEAAIQALARIGWVPAEPDGPEIGD